jgi:hypothetical protein
MVDALLQEAMRVCATHTNSFVAPDVRTGRQRSKQCGASLSMGDDG